MATRLTGIIRTFTFNLLPMGKITLNTLVQRNPGLVSSRIDGDTVMMSIDNGEYYGLNPIGTKIWEIIETPVAVSQLISRLLGEFDVSPEECQADTMEFLNQLYAKNLLYIVE
jgi:hypothetical protein